MSGIGFAVKLDYAASTPAQECVFRCGRPEPPALEVGLNVAWDGRFVASAAEPNSGAQRVMHLAHPFCFDA